MIELRFLDDLTQSEIAAEIGIVQMHVSRRPQPERVRFAGSGYGDDRG
jgi:hypothetical protein